MSSKRIDIMSAVVSRMKTILVANGYHTDSGLNSFQWRKTPFAPAETPGLNVRDLEDKTTDLSQASAHSMPEEHGLMVAIDAVCNDEVTLRNMIADVRASVAVDETWGGIALRTWPISNTTIVDDQGLKALGAVIEIRIDYRTQKWQEN